MHRFDTLILRPLLIHKYDKDMKSRAQEFYEMFQNEGAELKRLYANEKKEQRRRAHESSQSTNHKGSRSEKAESSIMRAATIHKERRKSVLAKSLTEDHASNRGSQRGSGAFVSTTINEANKEEDEEDK